MLQLNQRKIVTLNGVTEDTEGLGKGSSSFQFRHRFQIEKGDPSTDLKKLFAPHP